MIDFEKEIARYGSSLSEREKEKARQVFNDLLASGRSFEWLYYAIQRLGNRSILDYQYLMFNKAFQEEVNELVGEAREAERKKKAHDAEICAKIEAQILLREEKERTMKIIFQPQKEKKKTKVDLAAIADMEDDDDGAMPQNERTCLFEKTDSIENLIRRVRGL